MESYNEDDYDYDENYDDHNAHQDQEENAIDTKN